VHDLHQYLRVGTFQISFETHNSESPEKESEGNGENNEGKVRANKYLVQPENLLCTKMDDWPVATHERGASDAA
jgi:hypothetical protein